MPFGMGTMVNIIKCWCITCCNIMINTLDMHLNNKSVLLIKLSDVRSVEPSDLSDFRPFIAVRTSQFVMWLTCFITIKN